MTDTTRIYVMTEPVLADTLAKVANGDHPDVVLAELYANADHQGVNDGDVGGD
jgi:hypothetical protein